jgi:hypothetical protein
MHDFIQSCIHACKKVSLTEIIQESMMSVFHGFRKSSLLAFFHAFNLASMIDDIQAIFFACNHTAIALGLLHDHRNR